MTDDVVDRNLRSSEATYSHISQIVELILTVDETEWTDIGNQASNLSGSRRLTTK